MNFCVLLLPFVAFHLTITVKNGIIILCKINQPAGFKKGTSNDS